MVDVHRGAALLAVGLCCLTLSWFLEDLRAALAAFGLVLVGGGVVVLAWAAKRED